ncbi:uncharacterized protein LOC134095982 isoform X2 [Sardina pilchardus]|uniref:uncharacterized protein LOC134095982 isoform X2 n=1 Tax=Sardina pilchardus TaxID=27697 RepID=UPI002E0D1D38
MTTFIRLFPYCAALELVLAAAVHGIRLHGASGPLTAQLGGSVLLPCSVETPLPLEELEVEWRRTDSDVLVHLFQEGEERPESQDYAYRGRAHFFTDKIAQGDYSLLLQNITSSDKGLYRCVVYSALDSREISCEIKNVDYLVVYGVHHAGFVYVGEEVVLPCSVDSHIPPEKLEEVAWKRTDNEILVLLYQHGVVLNDSSHERYKGRAEFFLSEIAKGNFSLRLKDVRTEDKGEFICVAHSGNIFANTTVVVPSLGLSTLHQLIVVLCIFAFGLSMASLIHFIKTGINGGAMRVHFFLIVSPNIALFVAFILWGFTEGFLDEASICSSVNLARILFLLLTTPYLDKFPKCLLSTIKISGILIQFSAITIAFYSVAFRNRRNINLLPKDSTAMRELTTFFVLMLVSCACGIIAATTQAICPSLCCIDGSKSNTRPKEKWSFIFMEICIMFQSFFTSIKARSMGIAFHVVFFVFCALLQPISLVLIRILRKRLRFGYLCWTVTMAVLVPAYIVSSLYHISQVRDIFGTIFPNEYAGIMAVTALLKLLSAVSLFEHPSNLQGMPQLIVYGFGSAGLCLVNSITLMTELLLKARNGKRSISDLRLVILPFDSISVSGWFFLLIYNYWTCNRGRGVDCSEILNERQDISPIEEEETLSPC